MKPKHTFSIITQSGLSSDEWKVLGLLYQPLIGSDAFSLYHTFYHLLNQRNYQSEVFTNQFLMDLLNIKIDQLTEATQKLEAINLLNTFKQNEHTVYQLKSPLTPRGFIQDTVLGQFLLTEMGKNMYNQLTNIFKVEKVDLTGYTEVTKNFDDVFNFIDGHHFYDSDVYLGKKSNLGVQIKDQINYEAFVEKLPNRAKKPILMSRLTKDTIQKLVFVYEFSIDEIVDLYIKTVLPNGDIDLGQLSFKAQNYYQNKKKDLPVVSETKALNDTETAINYLKTVSPIRIIELYAKDDYQMMSTDTVMQLMERNQVEIGIINALLLHILKFKEGHLPHLTYLEKVLETWIKKGIRKTEDAYHEVLNKSNFDDKTKKSTSKTKQVTKNPQWVDDYLEELKKEFEEGK
ncbi:DnaD domain protein [Acholeplasma granularum]|uniref:DnaD domain protein n=1 Tax=Acholeplasma granularum TaxID=264635 RepID=UPI0004717082|nr:DnaD domain protein [Acholeplasma granularum]